MKILSAIIIIISINSYCLADTSTSTEKSDYLTLKAKYMAINDQIIAGLSGAKTNISQIIEYHKKINEALKAEEEIKVKFKNSASKRNSALQKSEALLDNIDLEYENLVAPIIFIYTSGDFYNTDRLRFTTDKNKILSVISKWNKRYNENKFEKCFNDGAYLKTTACEDLRTTCSKKWLYGVENKRLYYDEVTPRFEISRVDVEHLDGDPRFKNKEINIVSQHEILFCSLLSFTDDVFGPIRVDTTDLWAYDSKNAKFKNNDFMNLSNNFPYSVESVKTICIDEAPSKTIAANLIDLHFKYPENHSIKMSYDRYAKWRAECNAAVQSVCQDTYIIKNRVVLTYVTVGCEKRDVTEEDVTKDMSWMNSEAAKLIHSTLLDTIGACQKASSEKYFWQHIEPKVPPDCKSKKK